jgi:hypothetical protein
MSRQMRGRQKDDMEGPLLLDVIRRLKGTPCCSRGLKNDMELLREKQSSLNTVRISVNCARMRCPMCPGGAAETH